MQQSGQAVYRSGGKDGVVKLSLAGGKPTPLAGFKNFNLVDGSPWADRVTSTGGGLTGGPGALFVTHEMKNVLTGQDLPVTPFAGAAQLTCSPTFCVGTSANGQARIQNLAGTKSAPLPDALANGSLCNCGGAAVYIGNPPTGGGFLLWTPVNGKIGTSNSPKNGSFFGWYGLAVLGWPQVAGGRISQYVSLGAIS